MPLDLPPTTRIPDSEYRKPDIEFVFDLDRAEPVLSVKVIDEVIPTAVFPDHASVDRFIMAVNAVSRRREMLERIPNAVRQ